MAGLPSELLVIEAGYVALAVVVVGAVVGGLEGKVGAAQR
jgi:hypothetical protein